jgi:ABC-type transport system involved in multi-copper enzyme maturation permease subunit
MFNLFRAEFLKQSRTTLFRVLLSAPAAIVAAIVVVLFLARTLTGTAGSPPSDSGILNGIGADFGGGIYFLTGNLLLSTVGGLYSLGLVIVAAVIITSEFSQSTIKMIATREASRPRIVLSKVLYLLGFAILVALVMLGSWLLLNLAFKLNYSLPLGLAEADTNALGKGIYFLFFSFTIYFIWGLFSLLLAMRFKSIPAAVILYFVYSTIDSIVTNFGALALRGDLGDNLPAWLTPLVDVIKFVAPFTINTNYARLAFQPTDQRYVPSISAVQAGIALALWALFFIALTIFVFQRRDITD